MTVRMFDLTYIIHLEDKIINSIGRFQTIQGSKEAK